MYIYIWQRSENSVSPRRHRAKKSLGGRMGGWTGGRMDGRTGGRMDGRTDGRAGGRTDGRTDGRADGRAQTPETSNLLEVPLNFTGL